MLDIIPVPALSDNYIWTLHNRRYAVVVDPGEAAPVLAYLKAHSLKLTAILCTHHHGDHIGGVNELTEVYNVPVYAPRVENISGATHRLDAGDKINLPELELTLDVLDMSGHTRGHLAYWSKGMVFCGDTLFGCGCGRLFEGTMEQLFQALKRLAALPDETKVYCAHEYTAANIRFALVCEPGNARLAQRAAEVKALREAGKPSLPSTIALEKATNPFLRCGEPEIVRSTQLRGNTETSELGVFTALRNWKDHFAA